MIERLCYMRFIIRLSIIICCISIFIIRVAGSFGAVNNNKKSDNGSQILTLLQQSLRSGDVENIKIIYCDIDILTRSNVTIKQLEGNMHSLIFEIKVDRKSKQISMLDRALSHTQSSTTQYKQGDFRYACIFYGHHKERLGTIFLTSNGDVAVLNGSYMHVNNQLHQWVKMIIKNRHKYPHKLLLSHPPA